MVFKIHEEDDAAASINICYRSWYIYTAMRSKTDKRGSRVASRAPKRNADRREGNIRSLIDLMYSWVRQNTAILDLRVEFRECENVSHAVRVAL